MNKIEPKPKLKFDPDPERSATLPASYYFDPAIYAKEKQKIWQRTWQYVGALEDLRQPGSYITAMIDDQPVFVVRAKSGDLKAFYNSCMHRGHTLLEGKGKKSLITCPFHAWTYATDGELKKAPNSENVAGFDYADFRLSEVRVEAFGLWAFVNLDPNAPPLAGMAGGLLDEMREKITGFDDLKYVRTDSFDLKANWKFILDGLECYHCPIIHPQIMGGPNAYVTKSFDTTESTYYSTHINRGNYEMIEKDRAKLPYDFGPATLKDIVIWFLWPNLVFVAHQGPPNIKVLQAAATGAETSQRHMHMFCENNPPTEHDMGHIRNYRDVAWPQDREAMEKQAIGVKALGYRQGRLMVDAQRSWQSEHGTHHFQKLVWEALNGPNY
jgi:carnitine monooxygenase subunit